MAEFTITDFAVHSVDLIDDQTSITFSFVKPSTTTLGGYYLYMSSTGVVYTHEKTRIDAIQTQDDSDKTYDVDGITYFEHTLPYTTTEGRLLYFKLTWLSTARAENTSTGIETAYTYPEKPSNVFAVYDGLQVDLSWDALDFTSNRNDTFVNYNIYRDAVLAVNNSTYDSLTELLSNTIFTVGMHVWIIDKYKKSQWWGIVTTAGEFDLSTTKVTLQSDNTEEYIVKIDNLEILIEHGDPELIGTAVDPAYTDTTYENNAHYIYSVTSTALGTRASNPTKYKCYPIAMTFAYPYLRPVENSSTGILANPYWRKIKNVLIDYHYYDKSAFALPYAKNTAFNLKGYLGVSNCTVDIYINDIYGFAVTSGDYGEFEFDYAFPKEITEIKIRSRDHLNIGISRTSSTYSIRTLNIYTWYAILGEQYKQITVEVDALISDVSIENCRYSSFEDKFSPFVEVYKQGDESETKFINIASEVYKAFEYTSFDKSLEMMLDVFNDNIDEFDHYEIYYNEDLYGTQRTLYTFTVSSTGLTRGNYYYGVSACKNNGEETPVSTLRVDRRWWPAPYKNTNVLLWDYTVDADSYKIYRGNSFSELYFLTSTGHNVFVDINHLTANTGIIPIEYNFTDLEKPINLELYDRYGVNNLLLRLKKTSCLAIILYGTGDSLLEDYDIERIISLFKKFIPPELKYTIIFANDTKVILYPDGTEVDLLEHYTYAHYDLSYYYHSTITTNEVYS